MTKVSEARTLMVEAFFTVRRTTTLVFGSLLLIATTVAGGPPRQIPVDQPIRLRIEGYVGAPPPHTVLESDWRVAHRDKTYRLAVTRLSVLTGAVTSGSVIEAVRPYGLAFRLDGAEETLSQFESVPRGQKVALIAVTRLGSTRLHLGGVELIEPP